MATASAIAKRTEKRQIEILEAVKMMMTVDRTDEILEVILDIGLQTRQASIAVGSMADEIVNLKAGIAELKAAVTPLPTSRRPKK